MTPDPTANARAGSHSNREAGHFLVFWCVGQPAGHLAEGWYWTTSGAYGGAFETSDEAHKDAERMLGCDIPS